MATAEPNVYPATIAGQIERLQQAKADLKTAIEGKGVTVSSSAKLDTYPALVGSIQTGGGGGTMYTYISLGGTMDSLTRSEAATMQGIQMYDAMMHRWSDGIPNRPPDPNMQYYYRFTGGSFTNSGNHTIHAMCVGDENDTTIFSLYSPY